ncbi:unnamed protein product, partial [Polarella glacialis]
MARRGPPGPKGPPEPLRSRECIMGLPNLNKKDMKKVADGNCLMSFSAGVFNLCLSMFIAVAMENPHSSRLWQAQPIFALTHRAQVFSDFTDFCIDSGAGSQCLAYASKGNVLLDPSSGVVKLCDLAHGRALDTPLRPYSPEEPKLRESSTREARRLNYRAPELLLRQAVYGPAADVWSAGALLAEAALGEPLFPSRCEIEHLFRVFRLLGTPGQDNWKEALVMPNFSPKFPVYKPVDLQRAARKARGTEQERALLKQELGPERQEVLVIALRLGSVLGVAGMNLFLSMVCLEPAKRCTTEKTLQSKFLLAWRPRPTSSQRSCLFASQIRRRSVLSQPSPSAPRQQRSFSALQAWSSLCCHSQGSQDTVVDTEALTPGTVVARSMASISIGSQPGRERALVSAPQAADALWPPLWAEMARQDANFRADLIDCELGPAGLELRASKVDRIIRLASELALSDGTMHLAVALLDAATPLVADSGGFDVSEGASGSVSGSQSDLSDAQGEQDLTEIACLKLADSFNELSNEYYARERTDHYIVATRGRWSSKRIIAAEKELVTRLQFQLHRPTAAWFLRSCIAAGGKPLQEASQVRNLARLLADVCLMDGELQVYPASLRAQIALLLAVYATEASSIPEGLAGNLVTPLLLWAPVRAATCWANSRESALPCFMRTVHVLLSRREAWSARKLHAVERRHPSAARRQLPRQFP